MNDSAQVPSPPSASPAQEMLALEDALLHGDHAGAAALLAEDFLEVHAAGGVATRDEVLQWLRTRDAAARWDFSDFSVQELAAGLRLVTYHAIRTAPQRSASKGARHASLWRYSPQLQQWQLCFHQATKVL